MKGDGVRGGGYFIMMYIDYMVVSKAMEMSHLVRWLDDDWEEPTGSACRGKFPGLDHDHEA
jgi:hypothetical protein